MKIRHFVAIFLFYGSALFGQEIDYSVIFTGVDDAHTLKMLKDTSQLLSLQKSHPAVSLNALRYRAELDIPEFIKVLRSQGYYEAEVKIELQELRKGVRVNILIVPGKLYRIETFDLSLYCNSLEETQRECCELTLEQMGIQIGSPALAQTIINAELKAMQLLAECGYPLAKMEKREMVADGETKGVRVHLFIKTEHQKLFGASTIVGNERVKSAYIEGKRAWKEGEVYDNRKVEQTQQELLNSGLFSSVLITHAELANTAGELRMKIDVSETKQRTLNLGVSYQTVFGPGITFGWENRNIAGMGRKVNFQGDITRISQTGLATYTHPEFMRPDQDLVLQAQAAHEALFAYSMRSYNVMHRLDRRFDECLRGAFSVLGEKLYVTASVHNGNYWLLEIPLYLRYSTANDLLNPTKGVILEFTTTPVFNIPNLKQSYLMQEISQSSYFSLTKNDTVVLAEELTVGFLFSENLKSIPLSKRFLGGSEQELRGYRYRTVSPLEDHKPKGGRSAIYFTFESRFRISKPIGLVPFFDIGNVYASPLPSCGGKWLKSMGLGLRYFSFMGPFRVDLAFPLNRRKGIDPVYRVLASIGQMF